MSQPAQYNDYRNAKFYFKSFKDVEDFKEKGKQAVETLLKSSRDKFDFIAKYKYGFDKDSVGTTRELAEEGDFKEFIEPLVLDQAISAFNKILEDIEMSGDTKKSRIVVTDDKRGIFDFGLASKGLYRVIEFYSQALADELPDEFQVLPKGVIPANFINKNKLDQFIYKSPTNDKTYFAIRRQKGTTEILALRPQTLLSTTENGIEYSSINEFKGIKLEFASTTKKSYLMFKNKGGKAKYVDLYCVIGGTADLKSIGMLNRTLPILLASKVLEEQGIKTRIYGMRMYQRISDKTRNEINQFVNYTYLLKDYGQDLDFNWLAINLADTRFFRWNLWKYTSAMLQNENIKLNDLGYGRTVYGGNELLEVFGRYKNWYFEEIKAGRMEENPIDKRLIITGGFYPDNRIERDKIEAEFHRIIDVVDFQFNTTEKALNTIYKRMEQDYPEYSKWRLNDKFRSYVVRILTDAYSYPVKGAYATPQAEQDDLEKDYELKMEAVANFLSNID